MIMRFIEFFALVTTLIGYYMVTHGMIEAGAIVALVSNFLWIYYGHELENAGFGLMFLNAVFILVNFSILGVL